MIYIGHVLAWLAICFILSLAGEIKANSVSTWIIGSIIISCLMAVPTVVLHVAYLVH